MPARAGGEDSLAFIVGLFDSAEAASRALAQIDWQAFRLERDAVRVASQDRSGLDGFARERAYTHERIGHSGAALVVIRSEHANLAELMPALAAAGMQFLETQYHDPRPYSEYPYGDGVQPERETWVLHESGSLEPAPEPSGSPPDAAPGYATQAEPAPPDAAPTAPPGDRPAAARQSGKE
jgi:hypothetical protein